MAKKAEKISLEETLKSLEKDYGKGTVVNGTNFENYNNVISTGSISLDLALGIGGLPQGKIVELIGWESSGKSSITLNVIANAQKQGINCLLVDGENSFDEKYATALGVDPSKLLIVQLDKEGGERAYNIAQRLIESGEIGLCVFDSQNSLQPKSVMEGEVGDSAIGKHARMLNQAVVKMNNVAQENNCLIIFISQLREKIGVMFGSPETTQGGNALRFYSHIRLDIRKSVVKEGDVAFANRTKVKVIKNKMSPPFKTAEFDILFGIGIDKISEIIDLANNLEILKKWGKTITLNDEKYELEDFKQLLENNEEFYNSLREKIINFNKTKEIQ